MEATTPQAVEVLAMEKVSINDSSTSIVLNGDQILWLLHFICERYCPPQGLMSYGSCKPSCRDSQMPDRWWVRWCWWWQTNWNWITYVQLYYHPILLWGPTSPGRPAQWGTLSRLSGTAPTAAWLRARVMDLLRTMVRLSSSSSWLMARTLVTAIQHFLILYFALKNQRCLFALVPHYCSFGIWLLGLKMFHRMHLQWPHPARIWRVPANGLN